VLQAHRRFLWPAATPLLSSLVVIGAYLGFAALAQGAQDSAEDLPVSAEVVLAWGTTAGVVALTLPLLLPVLRGGTRLRPTLTFPAGVARRALALAGAGIAALLAQQVAVVVTMGLANARGTDGSWPIFQYVQAVYLLPYAVLAVPLATVAFPRLAEHAATRDRDAFSRTAASTTRAVLLVSLVGAATLAGAAPAVTAVFAALDRADVAVMTPALVAMAPGLIGFALVAHLGRALNALHRPRAAALATAGGWAGVVLASWLLVTTVTAPERAVVGLAAGNSAGMLLAGVLLVTALARASGGASLAGVLRTVLVGALAAVAAAAAGRVAVDAVLGAGSGVGLAVVAGLAAAVVVLLVIALGVLAGDRGTALQAVGMLRRRQTAGTESASQ